MALAVNSKDEMSKGFTMKFLSRLRKRWRAGVATIIAGSMLAGGLSAAFAVDGEGDGAGHGGGREGSMMSLGSILRILVRFPNRQ